MTWDITADSKDTEADMEVSGATTVGTAGLTLVGTTGMAAATGATAADGGTGHTLGRHHQVADAASQRAAPLNRLRVPEK